MSNMSEKKCFLDGFKNRPYYSEVINSITEEQRKYLYDLFENAPVSLLSNLSIKRVAKGTVVVKEQTPVDYVYILINGFIQAAEYRMSDRMYYYTHFSPIEMFGSMEILLDHQQYMATLVSDTECLFLRMSAHSFIQWIQSDIVALMHETKRIGNYLLEQARKERVWIFLQGKDRLLMLLADRYVQTHDANGDCTIDYSRQDLSVLSGLSERTISRASKLLVQEEYISVNKKKIRINHDQYLRIKAYLKALILE